MSNNVAPAGQVVYQADNQHVETVKGVREKLHGLCKQRLMNRHVLVKTIDGHEYEGIIVFIDDGNVYLSLAVDEELNKRFFPYGPGFYGPVNPAGAMLPLVLYNLLAITLLM
ncbi:hypothetical protein [Paenibacillus sp. YN15]|uniref:hypothetical protein n=1 Tax=Paenibacillus sp. YN15 TaxID=1742774 RepID=UPI000DCE9B31|nr:hypothetical protein [Paenibacillus sp. YN15]RAV02365.1 hypothetical protein DQG13_10065 [Paenibacillus sp. YN15]